MDVATLQRKNACAMRVRAKEKECRLGVAQFRLSRGRELRLNGFLGSRRQALACVLILAW